MILAWRFLTKSFHGEFFFYTHKSPYADMANFTHTKSFCRNAWRFSSLKARFFGRPAADSQSRYLSPRLRTARSRLQCAMRSDGSDLSVFRLECAAAHGMNRDSRFLTSLIVHFFNIVRSVATHPSQALICIGCKQF